MVKIKLHIIGFNNTCHNIDEEYDNITLKDIYMYLIKKNILLTKLNKYCRFIHNGKILELKKPIFDSNYTVIELVNIYIIVNDKNFKEELGKILGNNINNNNIYNKQEYTIDEIEKIEINEDLCEYFKDNDFINLLNIVKEKPQYLEMVNSYLSHGNIINEIDFDNIDINEFHFEKEYDIVFRHLSSNINEWNENKVKKLLVNYNGNVNLTSRYLLI